MGSFMKWITRLAIALTVICGFLAVAFFYDAQFGSCSDGGPDCGAGVAAFYMFIVGVVGFGVTALAGHFIGKNIRESEAGDL